MYQRPGVETLRMAKPITHSGAFSDLIVDWAECPIVGPVY